VAEFIGSPAMNMLRGTAAAGGVSVNGTLLATHAEHQAAAPAGRKVIYGLRPEKISFAASGLAGEITMLEPTGPETYVSVKTAAGALVVRLAGHVAEQVGDTVHLSWSTDAVHLFDGETEKRLGR